MAKLYGTSPVVDRSAIAHGGTTLNLDSLTRTHSEATAPATPPGSDDGEGKDSGAEGSPAAHDIDELEGDPAADEAAPQPLPRAVGGTKAKLTVPSTPKEKKHAAPNASSASGSVKKRRITRDMEDVEGLVQTDADTRVRVAEVRAKAETQRALALRRMDLEDAAHRREHEARLAQDARAFQEGMMQGMFALIQRGQAQPPAAAPAPQAEDQWFDPNFDPNFNYGQFPGPADPM
jgi:hypothetical protein